MAAMRVFTREEFYSALEKNGFTFVKEITSENSLWHHEESGKHFTIPHYAMEGIPDCVLGEYLAAVDKLYSKPKGEDCGNKQYSVKKKKPPANITLAKK